jgi:hypothetical protein
MVAMHDVLAGGRIKVTVAVGASVASSRVQLGMLSKPTMATPFGEEAGAVSQLVIRRADMVFDGRRAGAP